MGIGARAQDFAVLLPGVPGGKPPRPTMRPRVNVPYTFPQAASRRRGQKEVGHQGFQTPKWSAVRRDRPIARPVQLFAGAATVTLRHYGAPLPLRERTSKRRTESSGGNPPARKDEHVQAKWAPVRRPDMRARKKKHVRSTTGTGEELLAPDKAQRRGGVEGGAFGCNGSRKQKQNGRRHAGHFKFDCVAFVTIVPAAGHAAPRAADTLRASDSRNRDARPPAGRRRRRIPGWKDRRSASGRCSR